VLASSFLLPSTAVNAFSAPPAGRLVPSEHPQDDSFSSSLLPVLSVQMSVFAALIAMRAVAMRSTAVEGIIFCIKLTESIVL